MDKEFEELMQLDTNINYDEKKMTTKQVPTSSKIQSSNVKVINKNFTTKN